MNWILLFSVGLGGFFGALSRLMLSGSIQKLLPISFPFGTLSVNIIGSFIIGFMVLYFDQMIAPNQKAIVITGFLGALTTFSTFSLETVYMIQSSLYTKALLNIGLNVLMSIFATILGMLLFKKIFSI